jgi:hypothetical protein
MHCSLRTAVLALLAPVAVGMTACTSSAPSPGGQAAAIGAEDACIDTRRIKKQTILSDQDIQFEMQNGDVWVNHLDKRCPGLATERAFSWDLHTNSVCSNRHVIHVLNGASCTLGEFTKQAPAAT